MLKSECFDIFNVFYNLFHLNASGYIEVRLRMVIILYVCTTNVLQVCLLFFSTQTRFFYYLLSVLSSPGMRDNV